MQFRRVPIEISYTVLHIPVYEFRTRFSYIFQLFRRGNVNALFVPVTMIINSVMKNNVRIGSVAFCRIVYYRILKSFHIFSQDSPFCYFLNFSVFPDFIDSSARYTAICPFMESSIEVQDTEYPSPSITLVKS